MVGNFQRPRAEFARRTTEHQQSEHQTIFREFHGRSRAGGTGAFATLPHDRNDSFDFAVAILWQSRKFHADPWNGRWRGRNDGGPAIVSFFASRRRFLGP